MDGITMRTRLQNAVLRCSPLLFLALAAAGFRGIAAAPPGDDAGTLIEQLEKASPDLRPAVARKLMLLGEKGLRETRAARDREQRPELKETLARVATFQLARKIVPALRERYETGLRFDGQYEDLKEEGPEVVGALLFLLDDEAIFPGDDAGTHVNLRFACCQALADVAGRDVLPSLRRMYHDPLLFPPLAERIGILMAIFGDTHAVDQEISRLEELVSQSEALEPGYLDWNARLSELYYQIRDYTRAAACYDRILLVFTENHRIARERSAAPGLLKAFEKEFALQYYNAACSRTLSGDLEKAREFLRKCIQLDPGHFENIEKDGDFAALRADDGYEEFRGELRKLLPPESF
jgi:tetratricopeptide (TPR) repeat protein